MDKQAKEKLYNRWTLLCRRLNEFSNYRLTTEKIEKWWEIIDSHYSEPHRAYHNWDHICECLKEFDEVANLFESPLTVELALFFHDVIYNPGTPDNELKSAALLSDFYFEIGLGICMSRLLICTDHNPDRLMTEDEQLFCAIDLAILGQFPPVHMAYARGIRYEYKDVPLDVYRAKRAEILEGFLKRDRIYIPEYFYQKYEDRARKNLAFEIEVLRSGEFPEK